MSNASKLEKYNLSKPFSRFSLRKFFLNIFIMKNRTDFCKMVETIVDLCLGGVFIMPIQQTVPSVTKDLIPH